MAQSLIVIDMMFWMKYLIVSDGRRRNDLENRKRQVVRARSRRKMLERSRA